MHYFVLFSWVLGNVAAFFIGELLHEAYDIAFGFGLIFLGFSTLFWLISQAQNKIKHYRFWDEVLTLSIYMLCALMLFVNFMVLIQMPFVEYGFGEKHVNYAVFVIGGSFFVFVSAVSVYLIAHTGVANILGIVLLHFVGPPLAILLFQHFLAYVILFVFLFVLFCNVSVNSPGNRFIRFFLIPYIPMAILVFLVYMIDYSGTWYFTDEYSEWTILVSMIVATIFGSALIIKRNIEPLE